MKYETNSRNSIAACAFLLLFLGFTSVLFPQSLSSGHDAVLKLVPPLRPKFRSVFTTAT